jgi:hypothetical protein
MLYLVGGVSRAGKSFLARRLLTQHRIPYFSLDILMMGFANGYPAFGLDPETSAFVRGEQLWPIVRAMAVNILEEVLVHPTYLLEGDTLLPEHVAELAHNYAGQVRACFIGYAQLNVIEKLRDIRQSEADWANYYTDEQALAFLAGEVEYSRYLQRECAAHGLRYFDSSEDLAAAVDEAAAYLTRE